MSDLGTDSLAHTTSRRRRDTRGKRLREATRLRPAARSKSIVDGRVPPLLVPIKITAAIFKPSPKFGQCCDWVEHNPGTFRESEGACLPQAGLVLSNVRLIEELRAPRQRLVAAQDAERRKLERNLHDGAQQQLVALAVVWSSESPQRGWPSERPRCLASRCPRTVNRCLTESVRMVVGGSPPPGWSFVRWNGCRVCRPSWVAGGTPMPTSFPNGPLRAAEGVVFPGLEWPGPSSALGTSKGPSGRSSSLRGRPPWRPAGGAVPSSG
jgi:hypothetical protein